MERNGGKEHGISGTDLSYFRMRGRAHAAVDLAVCARVGSGVGCFFWLVRKHQPFFVIRECIRRRVRDAARYFVFWTRAIMLSTGLLMLTHEK